MSMDTLLPRGRVGAAGLVALALFGFLGFDSSPAAAWTKNQIARHERYLACKARLQKDPPCNQVWTRHCVRMCRGRLI